MYVCVLQFCGTCVNIITVCDVPATPDIDYIALPLSIMTDENANNTGRLCFTIEVLDDTFLEPVECLPITISFPDDLIEMLQFEATDTIMCCITDNGMLIYMYVLELCTPTILYFS